MKDDALNRFLAGNADDREQQDIESLLAKSETVVNFDVDSTKNDSLLDALKCANVGEQESASLHDLALRIESMVPQQPISLNAVSSFFDQTEIPGDLGCIANYRIIELIATGGSSLIFRAIDSDSERPICIKILKPTNQFNSEAIARFEREATEASELHHSRIMDVVESGIQNGLPWMAMPMIPGMTLRERIQQDGKLDSSIAFEFARQIAQGLQHAHAKSVLHRDIKPDNIWVCDNDQIKIFDFGLARIEDGSPPITHFGTVIGTPSYMSPEQITGKIVDQRSDLFSLGIVLLEMLTGESPFRKSNLFSTLISVAGNQINVDELDSAASLNADARRLVSDLLQIDPTGRPQSAAELIQRIDAMDLRDEKPAKPKTQDSSIWIKLIAASALFAGVCWASYSLFMLDGKGTIVVKASDPEVEVKIRDETVSVLDRKTNKSFEIRIGETRLPTGEYQLVANDSSGDLEFSSDTILVRRNQKTILTVSLVQNKNFETKSSNNAVAGRSDSEKALTNASYDPIARDDFPKLLPALPAQSVSRDTLPRISPLALVQQPAKVDGLESWSIEFPGPDPGYHYRFVQNCSRELTTTVHDGLTKIWDDSGLKFVLPSRGSVAKVLFDNKHPNLVACSSYNYNRASNLQGNSNLYELSIWRLGKDYAELLYRIPTSSLIIGWDNGYRLAYFDQGRLTVLRLDNGLSERVSEQLDQDLASQVRMGDAQFSPDGRYLAISNYEKIIVWDFLTGRKLVERDQEAKYHLQSEKLFWFGSNSREIALRVDMSNFEIWTLGKVEPDKRLTFANLERRSSCEFSSDLQRFVCISNWPSISNDVETDDVAKNDKDIDAIKRRLKDITKRYLVAKNLDDQQESNCLISGGISDVKILWDAADKLTLKIQRFHDLKVSLQDLQDPKFSIETQRFEGYHSSDEQHWNKPVVFANKNEVVIQTGGQGRPRPQAKKLSFAQSKPTIMVESVESWEEYADSDKILDEFVPDLPDDVDNVNVYRWDDRLLISGVEDSAVTDAGMPRKTFWIADPSSQTTSKTRIFNDFRVDSIHYATGDTVIFTGEELENSRPQAINAGTGSMVSYFNARIRKDRISSFKRFDANVVHRVTFSQSGEYFCVQSNEEEKSVRQFPTNRSPSELKFYAWRRIMRGNSFPLATTVIEAPQIYRPGWYKGQDQSVIWHPDKDVAFVRSRFGKLSVFNAESSGFRVPNYIGLRIYGNETAPYAAEHGWWMFKTNRLMALDHTGGYLGQVVFDPADRRSMELENPRWIMADGAMDTNASRKGLFAVYCKSDRVYCKALTSLGSDPDDPRLPTFDKIPFLND